MQYGRSIPKGTKETTDKAFFVVFLGSSSILLGLSRTLIAYHKRFVSSFSRLICIAKKPDARKSLGNGGLFLIVLQIMPGEIEYFVICDLSEYFNGLWNSFNEM